MRDASELDVSVYVSLQQTFLLWAQVAVKGIAGDPLEPGKVFMMSQRWMLFILLVFSYWSWQLVMSFCTSMLFGFSLLVIWCWNSLVLDLLVARMVRAMAP